MSTHEGRSNSKRISRRPVSLALRLRTHPPQPRIAPVTALTRRLGSSLEIALICRAQGIVPGSIGSRKLEAFLTLEVIGICERADQVVRNQDCGSLENGGVLLVGW